MLDQGAEGAILHGLDGARRYVRGQVPAEAPPAKPEPTGAKTWQEDDPLLGGLDRLRIGASGQDFGKALGTGEAGRAARPGWVAWLRALGGGGGIPSPK